MYMAYGTKAPIKKKKMRALSATQKTLLREHKGKHTAKHMAVMRKSMKGGKCFEQAHRAAMKSVGK